MRLISNYPRQLVLPSPITIIATSTAAPALPKRADQPAICHGQGCLSVPSPPPPPPPPATTTPPPAAPTPRDNGGPATITEQVTIHVWTTIISWRTAYNTVVGVTSFNTIATTTTTITQPTTVTQKVDVTIPVTVTAPPLATTSSAPEPVQTKKHALQTGDVIAIVLAVIIVILLGAMYVLTRRFYRMYRAERVLRKQVQTEGTELRAGNGVPADGKDGEEWEKLGWSSRAGGDSS
ncbi:hypothetical protein N7G274_010525 [Stereocaulon virgatum]|uniref:Uncharacterized protein n=1 Tax=Stereocaulon virgatum TaxID=373712 RepID=A0ABR3ZUF7_9LECA